MKHKGRWLAPLCANASTGWIGFAVRVKVEKRSRSRSLMLRDRIKKSGFGYFA
ncbi:MAG: hypothetical protein WBA88_00535 [Pseudaminobacter sp.]